MYSALQLRNVQGSTSRVSSISPDPGFAGFAGILIEDQLAPKSCGHVKGKRVVSREEAVARIRAASDARDEGADILIVARTDARQAISFEVCKRSTEPRSAIMVHL